MEKRDEKKHFQRRYKDGQLVYSYIFYYYNILIVNISI